MTATAQDVVNRAQAFSTLNTGLTNDTGDMLWRIRMDQQALFSSVAALTRDYFQTTVSISSTAGASGRSFDLSTLTLPVERVLMAILQDGRTLSQVDILDQDAELSPRYYVQGLKLVEVGNDWGASGSKTASLTYVFGMTDIDPTGSLTQNLSIPAQWIDLLVLPLAMYLAQKDPGRDAAEIQRLQQMLDDRQQAFSSYLATYGGIEVRRLEIPVPSTESKKA